MKILIACMHHPVHPGRWYTDAFQRLGHDVRHVGAYPTADASANKYAWEPMGHWDVTWRDWQPDLVIYPETTYREWRHSGYRDVPHVNITTCNNVCNMSSLGHAHYFVAQKYSREWPVDGPNMTWLPCAYDPTVHTPSPKPWAQRTWDVSLVGAIYPNRKEYLIALAESGLNVCRATNVFYDEFVQIYHDTRISLCINEQQSPMMRYFESAAMGNLILGDYCRDMVELGAQGIITVNSPEDAVFYARHYLTRPQLAQEHIGRAMAWVQDHTWDRRAQQIVEWYERERMKA